MHGDIQVYKLIEYSNVRVIGTNLATAGKEKMVAPKEKEKETATELARKKKLKLLKALIVLQNKKGIFFGKKIIKKHTFRETGNVQKLHIDIFDQ